MTLSLLMMLAPNVALADPPGPPPACGVTIDRLFCYRTTHIRKLDSDPQRDAWEVMFEFVNWTDQDVVGIDVAMNIGGLRQVQGLPPYFMDARIDPNGRPFGPRAIPPIGNLGLINDWHVPVVRPNHVTFGAFAPGEMPGTPVPHPMATGTVAGASTTYHGVYDPQFANSTLGECSAALTQMIPGSTASGSTIRASSRTLDDGDNVRDGFVFVIDDFDPGETISFNWVLLVGDGAEISGYVDASGTVQGDPMGFGTFSLTLYPNGLPAEPIFNVNAGFDPPNAFDPNQDDEYLWAEDEDPVTGIDQYPINPIPGGMPGQGIYLGLEMGAAVTAPFVEPEAATGGGTFTFEGGPVEMGDNIVAMDEPVPFLLEVPQFAQPGTQITMRATGAVPGDAVWFIYGPAEGPGPCPDVLSGDCVNIVDARAFGETVADENGEAMMDVDVPSNLNNGLTTLVQAVGIRNSVFEGQPIGSNYRTDPAPVTTGVDPLNPCPGDADTDGDGVCDSVDLCDGDDALGDADSDGVCGAIDSDADGLYDSEELLLGTLPDDPDTDGDGLLDGIEVNTFGTDPTLVDTDGGGVDDFTEITADATNPLVAADDLVTSSQNPCDASTYCAELNALGLGGTATGDLQPLVGDSVIFRVGWSGGDDQCFGSPPTESRQWNVNSATDPTVAFEAESIGPGGQLFFDNLDAVDVTVDVYSDAMSMSMFITVNDLLFAIGYLDDGGGFGGCSDPLPIEYTSTGPIDVFQNTDVLTSPLGFGTFRMQSQP